MASTDGQKGTFTGAKQRHGDSELFARALRNQYSRMSNTGQRLLCHSSAENAAIEFDNLIIWAFLLAFFKHSLRHDHTEHCLTSNDKNSDLSMMTSLKIYVSVLYCIVYI